MGGVTVSLAGASYSGVGETGSGGYYEFSILPPGNYRVTYTKSGYTTQSLDISLLEGEGKNMGTVVMEAVLKGKIHGNVVDVKGNLIYSVNLKLRNVKTKATKGMASDGDGFYEFNDLDAGTYIIFATKKKYKNTQKTVTLAEGEDKEMAIEMKKTAKQAKGAPVRMRAISGL